VSLEQLKNLEQEAQRLSNQQDSHNFAEKTLASLRNGPQTLSYIASNLMPGWQYGSDEIARAALMEVLDEAKLDILRLAELRLAAKSRELKIDAARRRAVIAASILPIPPTTGQ
jgi:hypothetical protein